MSTPPRQLFVAGATGATGRTLMRQGLARGVSVIAHVRPKSAQEEPARSWPRKAVLELGDSEALVEAMRGSTTVLQLIGTMRKRFASGDTYETSDIGTTRQLVEAAKRAGVDHVVLLSSVGAGRPMGAYLKAKAEAERLVRESGLAWTVVRPPAFEGEYHRPPGLLHTLSRLKPLRNLRPIHLEQLAAVLLRVAEQRAPLNAVLEGDSLWAEVAATGVQPPSGA
ncbi:NAD(P)-binding oxidoreductase [Pyxidicoccus xibeiensis]|uniref:NAD(P)-binding oxidoreductase n=1 Tax=Pyxidicoccus xibeiensis TaxID=2906759 RepID=UPI0020A6FD18|nr:NAD(P)-binding oxidoreductase [Pyxidicoccus xibeiensis]MCP3143003.1 SDR family oxidoreductase [Pyxidicoccus xibeiensis]